MNEGGKIRGINGKVKGFLERGKGLWKWLKKVAWIDEEGGNEIRGKEWKL